MDTNTMDKLKLIGFRQCTCTTCHKLFLRQYFVRAEKKQFRTCELFKCESCRRIFNKDSHLKLHAQTHSNATPPMTCKDCNRKRRERAHQTTTHDCQTCGKQFAKKCNLDRHKLTHTGEKPYLCRVCSAAFARSDNCMRHEKTHV